MKSKPKLEKTQSLVEFDYERKVAERKKNCAICKLPENVKEELRVARRKKIDRDTVIAWLATLGHKVDDLDFQTHNAGLHEQRESRIPA